MATIPSAPNGRSVSPARREGERLLAEREIKSRIIATDQAAKQRDEQLDDKIEALEDELERLKQLKQPNRGMLDPQLVRPGGGGRRMVARVLERDYGITGPINVEIATEIASATLDATPADADQFGYSQGGLLRRFSWANLKSFFALAVHGHVIADTTGLQAALDLKSPLASPTFTGDPKAPTPLTADNDTSIATTAFVKAQGYATLASPTFTGDPKAPTPATADNDTSVATTAFVKAQAYATIAASTINVADRTALKALDTTSVTAAVLKEVGREGVFVWKTGNYSAQIAADTQEAVYVKANAIASAAGSWVRQFDGAEDLRWYGLKSGAGNAAANTVALTAAVRTGANLCIPVNGTFEFNGPITFTSFNNFTIRGNGRSSVLKLMTNTDGLIFVSANRFSITDLGFTSDTAVVTSANSDALVFNGAGSGVGTIARCEFSSISGNGMKLDFTGNSGSGFRIADNLFLSCGVVGAVQTGAASFDATDMNDSWIERNQFGTTALVPPARANVGSKMTRCKAGNYEGNYHWNNDIGCFFSDCDYTRIIGNRFETNYKAGVEIGQTSFFVFSNNTLHTNSLLATNTYNHANFFDCDMGIVANNSSFEWTGGVTQVPYCLTFDNNCAEIIVDANSLYGYVTAPILNNGTDIKVTNNMPRQLGNDRPYNLNFTGNVSVAAGTTMYAGPSGGAATQIVSAPVPEKGNAYKLYVACTAAPGAAQSYTVTMRKNGVDQALVATVSGAGVFSATATGNISIAQNDSLDFKVVTTAGAAASDLRISLAISG